MLVLVRDEEEEDALEELEALERLHAHEEEDAEEDGHRDEAQQRRDQRREADGQTDQHGRHALRACQFNPMYFGSSSLYFNYGARLKVV